MKRNSFLALFLGVLFAFPAFSQTPFLVDSKRIEDVSEAALRYLFTHDGLYGAKAICISTGMPLPLSFINRFADHSPRVVWSIECTFNLWSGSKYMKMNEPAVLIKITSIRWINSKEAQVKGGSVWGDFVRPPMTMNLTERDGRWLVKQVESGGVS